MKTFIHHQVTQGAINGHRPFLITKGINDWLPLGNRVRYHQEMMLLRTFWTFQFHSFSDKVDKSFEIQSILLRMINKCLGFQFFLTKLVYWWLDWEASLRFTVKYPKFHSLKPCLNNTNVWSWQHLQIQQWSVIKWMFGVIQPWQRLLFYNWPIWN